MDTTEKVFGDGSAGLQPLYDAWLRVREEGKNENVLCNEEHAKKFLLKLGYLETSEEVLRFLVPLVIRSGQGKKICLRDVYETFADNSNPNAVSAKVKYHLERTYDVVRDNIRLSYGFELGQRFVGVKNLVQKLGMLYTIYGV